jgi:hypothetical protein
MRLLLESPASRLTVTKPVRSIQPNTSLVQGQTLPSYTKDERQSLKLNGVAKARSKFSNGANHSNLTSV